jgi:hypothetical protein
MLAQGKDGWTSLQFSVGPGRIFNEAVVRVHEAITNVPTGHCETLTSLDHLPTEPNNWSRQADGFVIQGASRIADPHRS